MLTIIRITNFASLSMIPATFLEKHYGFWAAYTFATVALCLAAGLLLVAGPSLGMLDDQNTHVE